MPEGAAPFYAAGMKNPPSAPSAIPFAPTDTRTLPLETRIARQAYALWDRYGRPTDRDISIWLEAERQVLGVDASVNQQESGAVSAPALGTALTPETPRAGTPDGAVVATRKSAPAVRRVG